MPGRKPPAESHGAAELTVPLPLAQGELGEADARELDALMEQVEGASGFYCHGYKQKCLRRRIGVRMRANGVHRYREYAELLRTDAREYDRLLATVTINVSKFFRNFDVWEALREHVIPDLFAVRAPVVRIWSAGTASGEEAYSLAILMLDYAAQHDQAVWTERLRILATDIDREILERARRAEYGETALIETPAPLKERWFESGPPYRPREEVRRLVRFEEGDLIRDPFPEGQHLIVCRNAIIYFERAVQEKMFVKFHEALARGGYLLLGKVEALTGPAADRFRPVATRQRLFQRI